MIKSSNMFFLPNIASTTKGGITFSATNQKMNLSGTNEYQYIQYYNKDMTDKMIVGKTYFLQCSLRNRAILIQANILKNDDTYAYYNSLGNSSFTWTSDFKSINIVLQNSSAVGTTVNLSNITFGLYETDNISIPYEPYFDPYIESFADKKNLLNIPDKEETTTNGITYSIKNGVITLNGTTTGIFDLRVENIVEVEENQTYYFYQRVENTTTTLNLVSNIRNYDAEPTFFRYNNKSKKMTKTGYLTIHLYISNTNTTFTNAKFYLMLVEGSTPPTTFLPYQDKYSAFLNVKGKNLLALPDTEATTIDGITYSIKDGVISFSGTLTKVLNLWIPLNNSIQKNKTYYKKVFYNDTQLNEGNLWLCKELDNYRDRFQMFYGTIDVTYDITYLMIFIEANKTYTNETYKPMLVEGDTAPTEYEPYYSYTKKVLLNQPLRKFDYLTYEGVYRQTNEIVLDGTNNIYVDDKGKVFLLKIPNADSVGKNWLVNVASEIMITTSDLPLLPYYNISNDNKMGIGTNQGNIVLKLDDSADNSLNNWTFEKVNNYFKQNPITITYKTVDQTFEATSLTRLLFKNGYNKITSYDSINNNAIVDYLEYYKNKGD